MWRDVDPRDMERERPDIVRAKQDAETALAGNGRVLLRPSGTEPLLRVMVEGEDRAAVQQWAEQIAGVIRGLA